MKKIIALASFVLITLIAQQTFAEGIANLYYIDYVRIDKDGRGFVGFTSSLSGRPACVDTGYENALSFDASTAGGKAIFSMLVAAKAVGSRIYAKGTGTCDNYVGVVETWAWGRVED